MYMYMYMYMYKYMCMYIHVNVQHLEQLLRDTAPNSGVFNTAFRRPPPTGTVTHSAPHRNVT